MKSFVKLALGATVTALAVAAAPAYAQKVMRIAHLNPESPFESHSGAMTAVFKNLVETRSNGSIEVQLFPNGQLGKDNEVISQVKDGIVESCISSAGGLASHYPPVGVFDLPFAFPNIAVATQVIDKDSDFGKAFTADLEAKAGLKVLGMLDSGGFFAMTNSKRPITKAADLDGLRIRTMTNVSDQYAVIDVAGPMARHLLSKCVQIDLSPEAFAVGSGARTLAAKTQVVIRLLDDSPRFRLMTRRSFGPYLWAWVQDACREYA
jgi:heterotetrameric sarcosine oxidase gamma subunit